MKALAALGCLLFAFGCEAKAQNEGGIAPARLSVASESCGRTADCAGTLRCLDGVCLETSRSDVGDYHVAAAQLLLAAGDTDQAVTELRSAESEYKRLGQIPTDVDCALGSVLAELRADPLIAEEAAAKLHRCIQGLVDGSAARRAALRSLAKLAEAGFDPTHLAAADVADRYLTRAPQKPELDDVKVTVSADRKSSRKTFVEWLEKLGSDEVRRALAPCWQSHWEATKKDTLTVKLPYRYGFRLDPDDESGDRGVLKTTKYKPPSDAALAAATSCVESALAPVANEVSRRGGEYSWSSKLTITLKP